MPNARAELDGFLRSLDLAELDVHLVMVGEGGDLEFWPSVQHATDVDGIDVVLPDYVAMRLWDVVKAEGRDPDLIYRWTRQRGLCPVPSARGRT